MEAYYEVQLSKKKKHLFPLNKNVGHYIQKLPRQREPEWQEHNLTWTQSSLRHSIKSDGRVHQGQCFSFSSLVHTLRMGIWHQHMRLSFNCPSTPRKFGSWTVSMSIGRKQFM